MDSRGHIISIDIGSKGDMTQKIENLRYRTLLLLSSIMRN